MGGLKERRQMQEGGEAKGGEMTGLLSAWLHMCTSKTVLYAFVRRDK